MQEAIEVSPQQVRWQHHELLAVDPGKKHAGVAIFKNGQLSFATLARADNPLAVAMEVERIYRCSRNMSDPATADVLVVERQQVYPGIRKADPNDLLPLAECVGAVNALIYAPIRRLPLPKDWKGSTPKDIFSARIESGMSRLDLEAVDPKVPKSLRHNVIDAIGLGRWALTGKAY